MALPATRTAVTTVEKRTSVVFLPGLNEGVRAATPSFGKAVGRSTNDTTADSTSTSTLPAPASESGSNSRVESLSRDSRKGRDVRSAEVDLVGYQPLPGSVKLSNTIEKVLREAPFAEGNSKAMWRAFLTSRPFKELTTDGFWFVVAHEILGMPVDAASSPRFSRMAHVYCHMFDNAPPIFKDLWGSCFFEAWTLALLILLQESFPKSKPLFDNPSFRMRLLDLCAEWTLGMRPSFPLTGHWVLKFDKRPPSELELLKRRTFGAGLSGSTSSPVLSQGAAGTDNDRVRSAASTKRRERIPEHRLNYVPSRSVIEFGNSPLVHQHLKVLTGGKKASVTPVRLQVTGEATRTLRPFHEVGLRSVNDKIARSNAWRAAQAVRVHNSRPATADALTRVDQRREELLRQHATLRLETRSEISRMRADAAEDRFSIQEEARNLLSKGDVHEFSNFLVRNASKANKLGEAAEDGAGGSRRRRRNPATRGSGGGGQRNRKTSPENAD